RRQSERRRGATRRGRRRLCAGAQPGARRTLLLPPDRAPLRPAGDLSARLGPRAKRLRPGASRGREARRVPARKGGERAMQLRGRRVAGVGGDRPRKRVRTLRRGVEELHFLVPPVGTIRRDARSAYHGPARRALLHRRYGRAKVKLFRVKSFAGIAARTLRATVGLMLVMQ